MRTRRWTLALLLVAAVAAPLATLDAQPPPVEEFVPISELPPEEALPAAPLLIAAYAFVWVVVLGYLWSIWRRLQRVEREFAAVAGRTAAARRS
jgi:CcmD family protein